ncbi:MAG: Fe-S cluster assembly protein SufD [Actinomycetia bacterium]|nr:Fe-S cluster assembly protein SufD [Actinomycetes bacterium]
MTVPTESAPLSARDLAPSLESFDPTLFEVPTGREEEWRFTPLRRINHAHEEISTAAEPEYSFTASEPARVATITPVQAQQAGALAPRDRVAALGWAATRSVAHIRVPDNAALAEPVILQVQTPAGTSAGHVLVEFGANAAGTVVIQHEGTGTYVGDISVLLGTGANATVVSLQQQDNDGVQLSNLRAVVGRDATLRGVAVTLGGSLVRFASSVRYEGPGGDVDLLGAFFTSAGQHHEHRLFVDHNAPDCRSNVAYKGALAGKKAHSVWIGDVLIRANATGTNTYELNRNLLLTDGARADSVPNLEIETGEVGGAGHAAATGRFDEEQLFYLQSRGIPAHEARKLVVHGFFADLIRKINIPAVADTLTAQVDQKLEQVSAVGAA